MSRKRRSEYPEYVRYMTRFDAGSLQKETGIPASLIHKARRGDVETFSDKTLEKFKTAYNQYWEYRLDKAGVTPDNWSPIINQHDLKELREVVRGVENTRKWDKRLERGGVNPDEREKVLQYDTEKEIVELIDKNERTAEKIVERRRERDKNLPNYSPEWHTVSDVLKQMARDTSRIPSDWAWIAKYGSPKRKKKWSPDTRKTKRRSRQYEH